MGSEFEMSIIDATCEMVHGSYRIL